MFITNDTFRFVNMDGFEKYYKILPNKELQVMGYGVIPMINIEKHNSATSNAHFYEEYCFTDQNSIKEHLKQSVQYFYSRLHYQPEIEERTSLHEILYRIDFPSTYKGKVMIQTSFTYLHWKIAEALEKEDKRYSAEKLDEE